LKCAVLLDVKSFIFDLPTAASAAVAQSHDRLAVEGPVGQPGEEPRFRVQFLLALEGIDAMGSLLVIDMFQLLDPGERLFGSFWGGVGLAVLGALLQEGLVIGPEGWKRAFLEGDEVLPVVLPANVHHRAVGIEGIEAQAQRQLGEVLLEPLRQASEGLQFTVLLAGLGVGVLDELAVQGDGQSLGRDQLGLQDVVVVERLLAALLLQAVGAMPLAEVQLPGGVEDHQEAAQESAMIHGFHPHQTMDHLPPQPRQRPRGHAAQEIVQRVGVSHGLLLGLGKPVEVGQGLGAVQLETQPPP